MKASDQGLQRPSVIIPFSDYRCLVVTNKEALSSISTLVWECAETENQESLLLKWAKSSSATLPLQLTLLVRWFIQSELTRDTFQFQIHPYTFEYDWTL